MVPNHLEVLDFLKFKLKQIFQIFCFIFDKCDIFSKQLQSFKEERMVPVWVSPGVEKEAFADPRFILCAPLHILVFDDGSG